MKFKDFFYENTAASSTRLNIFIIVLTTCIGLAYLTITSGIAVAEFLVLALGIGISGKAAQKFAEVKRSNEDQNV